METLNRVVHRRYKSRQIEQARNPGRYRTIPKPMGDGQIVYGDKVINNRNTSARPKRMYPEPEGWGYLANGEIGTVVGHRRTQRKNWKPDYLEIEFSTQAGTVFKYYPSDLDDDASASIELAVVDQVRLFRVEIPSREHRRSAMHSSPGFGHRSNRR